MIIKKLEGSTEEFEVVASFVLGEKTFITYTKDDIDMNGNVITYTNTIVDNNLMPVETDEEWAKIKETLLKMTKGENPEKLNPAPRELSETDTTKQEARHALSISKDFKKSIMEQYAGGEESEEAEEPVTPGEDIEIPEFNPVDVPVPEVTETPEPEPVPEVEVTPMPEPVVEEPTPEPEPIPEVKEEPVQEMDLKTKIDQVIKELEELKEML